MNPQDNPMTPLCGTCGRYHVPYDSPMGKAINDYISRGNPAYARLEPVCYHCGIRGVTVALKLDDGRPTCHNCVPVTGVP